MGQGHPGVNEDGAVLWKKLCDDLWTIGDVTGWDPSERFLDGVLEICYSWWPARWSWLIVIRISRLEMLAWNKTLIFINWSHQGFGGFCAGCYGRQMVTAEHQWKHRRHGISRKADRLQAWEYSFETHQHSAFWSFYTIHWLEPICNVYFFEANDWYSMFTRELASCILQKRSLNWRKSPTWARNGINI